MNKSSIEILGVNLGNFILKNSKRDKIIEGIAKKSIAGTESDSVWEVKRLSQNKPSNTNCETYAKFIVFQNIPKRNIWFFMEQVKNMTSRSTPYLDKCTRYNRHSIEAQFNSLKIKWIQKLWNPTNTL